jgi:hypothetical protein
MHGVAAEIAQEIGVLFTNNDSDAGPREQISEHHSCGTAASDRALRPKLLHIALQRFG